MRRKLPVDGIKRVVVKFAWKPILIKHYLVRFGRYYALQIFRDKWCTIDKHFYDGKDKYPTEMNFRYGK